MRNGMVIIGILALYGQVWADAQFERYVLAALDYGPGPGQAFAVHGGQAPGTPECITDFWVSEDLSAWIAESVLGRVQRFDSRGELVWVTNNVDCLNGIAVDEDGLLYAMGGGGRDDITILNQHGEKIWETRRWDERTEMMRATIVLVQRERDRRDVVVRDKWGHEYGRVSA